MEFKLLNKLYHAIWSSSFYRCPLEFDANVPLQIQVIKQCYASSLKRRCIPDHNRYVNISTSIPTLQSAFIVWMTLIHSTVKFHFRTCECHKYWSILFAVPPTTGFIKVHLKFSAIINYFPRIVRSLNPSTFSLVSYSQYTMNRSGLSQMLFYEACPESKDIKNFIFEFPCITSL